MLRDVGSWGSFAFAKMNAPNIIRQEIKTREPGSVLLSSVCDPYQSIEMKYEITRAVLEELYGTKFSVSVLTKSDLVERDVDVLGKADVGMTISMDEQHRKNWEPQASPVDKRIKVLKNMHELGIKTYVFIGPVIPYVTNVTKLIDELSFVDRVMIDKLRIKSGNWATIKPVLDLYANKEKISSILFSKKARYWEELRQQVRDICMEKGMHCWFCY
jgi:DNA repair photolyase